MAAVIRRKYKAVVNGKPVERLCDHWTVQYRDQAGKICRVRGFSERRPTVDLARAIDKALEDNRSVDAAIAEFHRRVKGDKTARPLDADVADYLNAIRAERDQMHVYILERRLRIVAGDCGWTTAQQINAGDFDKWLQQRRQSGARRGRAAGSNGASPKTLHEYRSAWLSFCRWLLKSKRLRVNPILDVEAIDYKRQKRVRRRRALTGDEVARLIAAAPADRRFIWAFMLYSGLRVAECAALQWGDVRLAADPPYLQLRAETTKAGRADTVSLAPALVDGLREIRPADASPTAPVFQKVPGLDDWRQDLEAAGIPYRDASGAQVDRHAMRKTLGTMLARQNVPPRVAQDVLRHATLAMTMEHYVDPKLLDKAEAVRGLPMPTLGKVG